jgi:enediyne biosynthesis protein E4
MRLRCFCHALLKICIPLSLLTCQKRIDSLFTLMGTEETGIDFINRIEEDRTLNILSYEYLYNGGGIAAGDFNNDGLTDLFFTGNQVPNKLFINKGGWKFVEIAEQANVSGKEGWKTGVAVADVNGDNLLDVYVCYSGPGTDQSRSNQLFINKGGDLPTFTDQALEYGLNAQGTYSTQASFFDYDLDGDLDMFLLNHAKITYSPFYNTRKLRNKRHRQYGNQLFRNDKGIFKDVSEHAGIHGSAINFGLGVSVSDLNLDGWPDIYVTNDYEEQDFFYLNNHDGTFKECLKETFRHISRFGMGSDVADYNNDALPDVFVADMLPEDSYRQKLLKGPDEYDKYSLLRDSGYHHQNMRNMLQLNLGNSKENIPQFSEIGRLAGVSGTDWSWCPLFVDLDNDGWKDLFVTNGYLRDYTNQDFLKYTFEDYKKTVAAGGQMSFDTMSLIKKIPTTEIANYCFRNTGNLQFKNISDEWGFREKALSNGAIYADLDNDGDQDIIVNNINEQAHVYQNNSSAELKNHFIKIQLIGEGLNASAIGAKVFIRTGDGLQLQENFPSRGFQSSMANQLIFGIGSRKIVDEIIVQWPNRTFSKHINVSPDHTVILRQGENSFDSVLVSKPIDLIFHPVINAGIDFKHQENRFVDYKLQYLLPYQLSRNGPCLVREDINGDGYDDFFAGGASGQSGQLFVSQKNSTFLKLAPAPWQVDSLSEDTDGAFLDVDSDGDPDLYVVSGGTEFSPEFGNLLQDRLYINNGNGHFTKSQGALPREKSNGSCVAFTDFDKDGDLDLFIGGKSLPGYFPLPAYSYLLRNDSKKGNVKFTDVTPDYLHKPGMINAAVWVDLNNDNWDDLVIAGDFTPILIYENNQGRLTEKEPVPNSSGMWSRIVADDIDGDGDKDLIAGNLGLNVQFKVSPAEPLTIHYADFNEDGEIDPILSYYIQGKPSVYPSRDEILEQLPHLKRKFVKYADYARANLGDILSADQIKTAKILKVETLHSMLVMNDGAEKFRMVPLPVEAQFSKVNGIVTDDFNHDGLKDILLAGNFFPFRVQLGRSDAGSGLLLSRNSEGEFSCLQFKQTGFYSTGDVRSMIKLKIQNGEYIITGINDDSLKLFKINKNE